MKEKIFKLVKRSSLQVVVALILFLNDISAQQLGGGDYHSAFICNNSIFSSGKNNKGQLGDGTLTESHIPVQIPNSTGFISIASGYEFTIGLKNDGTVWAWGGNNMGELGNSNFTSSTLPVKVVGLTNVIAIAVGGDHCIALKSDSTVWTWGSNVSGALGYYTTYSMNSTPAKVHGPGNVGFISGVTSIAAGELCSFALKGDGTLWAWGDNDYGQLGVYTSVGYSTIPVQVNISGVKSIASGGYFTLALLKNGTVYSWGASDYGKLGRPNSSSNIDKVTALSGIISISCGYHHALALKSDGTVWTWGCNSSGQLGDGTFTHHQTPAQVSSVFGGPISEIAGGLACGNGYSMARLSDGSVWTWGGNYNGRLGDNSTTNRNVPVKISGPCSNCSALSQPGLINGPASICIGTSQTYSVSTVPGATGYSWVLPGGWLGSSTSNVITVTAGSASGIISVTANNSCGSSSSQSITVNVQSIPQLPGIISGPMQVCAGTVNSYSILPVTGATSYSWNYPGSSVSHSTSNNISIISTSSGVVSITANNACGSSVARTLTLTVNNVPQQPGSIDGNSIVCSGSINTYSIAPVNGATSYSWSIPNGNTGSSTSNLISVTANNVGVISVAAINACGSSASQTLAISTVSVPQQPGIINNNISLYPLYRRNVMEAASAIACLPYLERQVIAGAYPLAIRVVAQAM
jgi:alpha-tubulin suppressor-like RCC1 family protein